MESEKNVKRNLWMYPVGTIGRDIIYQLFNSFILTYILVTRTLDAAQLSAITAIMIFARIFDAANDPIMGVIIEKTRSRFGKFKPWLVIGMITTAAVIIYIFNTRTQGWDFVLAFGIIYFLYSITYTMHDISYWGMVPALSSNPDTRNKFTSRAVLFAGVGATLAGLLIPMLTVGESAIPGGAQTAYGIVAIGTCVIALFFICFTIFGVVENKDVVEEGNTKKSKTFKEILKVIAKNKPLLWIIVAFAIQQIGNGLVAGGIGSIYVYFQYGYEGGLYGTFSTVGVLATAFLMLFFPAISKKFNRKLLMKILLCISAFGTLLMLISPVVSGFGFWVLTIGYMFANFGQYGFYLIMMISILNTVEYNEYISGDRDEAVVASVRPFLTKFASAIVVGLTSLSYIIFGVTEKTNIISEAENACTSGLLSEVDKIARINEVIGSIGNGTKIGLLLVMSLVPIALLTLSNFIYQKKYTLDEAEYDRICQELQERKETK